MLKMLSEFGDNLKKYLNVIFKLWNGETKEENIVI